MASKKFIFKQDYQATATSFTGFVNAPIAMFKKGDIYPLQIATIQPAWLPYKNYIFSYTHPSNPNLKATYTIPGSVLKEYTTKDASVKDSTSSSYSGDEIYYKGYRIKLWPFRSSKSFGYSIYEGDSDKYILSTKGPAGTYEKALKLAMETIDKRIERFSQSSYASKPYIGNKQSSYLGESVISKEKEENLKNAFAVIGALFIALIIYIYIMDFKNIE